MKPSAFRLLVWEVLALAVLSVAVGLGWLSGIDRAVMEWLVFLRTPLMEACMRAVTFFGSSPWTALALIGMSVWVWRQTGRQAALMLIGTFLLGMGVEVVLRLVVAHWRPDTLVVPSVMSWHQRVELAGFPSGHAYRSAFVFGWLAYQWHGLHRSWGRQAAFASFFLIALVGISRVALYRHWPSDVLGSWLLVAMVLPLTLPGRGRASA